MCMWFMIKYYAKLGWTTKKYLLFLLFKNPTLKSNYTEQACSSSGNEEQKFLFFINVCVIRKECSYSCGTHIAICLALVCLSHMYTKGTCGLDEVWEKMRHWRGRLGEEEKKVKGVEKQMWLMVKVEENSAMREDENLFGAAWSHVKIDRDKWVSPISL